MELKEQLEKLHKTFDEFKKANDARLDEIQKKGFASQESEQKVNRIETEIQKLEKAIDQVSATLNRTGGAGGETEEQKAKKLELLAKKQVGAFLRKGKGGISGDGGNAFQMTDEFKQYLESKDMSVDSDVDGGFLVLPEISAAVETKVFESSPIRQLASVATISTDSLEIYEDLDEAGDAWVGETEARSTTSTPQIKKEIIYVHEQQAMPKITQKLLDDARWNMEAWLSGKVGDKFGRSEATAFVSGNGVKKPKGILSYASGDAFGKIERQETAANNALASDDLINVQNILKEPYQLNASWLMNRVMLGRIRKIKNSVSGDYMWQPGLAAGTPSTLLGKPVYMAADLPGSITADTDSIIYGDIRAGYQVLDRTGIRILRDPYTVKGFVLFYTTKRVGGGVKNFEAIKVLKFKA